MGTSLDAIHLVLRSLVSTEPWLRDPNVVPLPWRQPIFEDTLRRATEDGSANNRPPLKLGIYSTNNVVNPHPPIARGLRMVVEALRKAGHKASELSCWILSKSSRALIALHQIGSRLDAAQSIDCQTYSRNISAS